MQKNLYFLPDWQGHWSFRPIFPVSLKSLGSGGGSDLGLFCGTGLVDGIAFSCFRLRLKRRSLEGAVGFDSGEGFVRRFVEEQLVEQGLVGWGVGVEFVLVGGLEGVEGGECVGGAAELFGVLGDGGFAVGGAGAGGGLGVELSSGKTWLG